MGSSSAWSCARRWGRGELFTFLRLLRILWPTADAHMANGVIARRWLPKLLTGSLLLQRLMGQQTPPDPLHVQLICTTETSEN